MASASSRPGRRGPPVDAIPRAPVLKALIRAETGPSVGLGHLQRCMALAAALEQEGVAEPVFLAAEATAVEWLDRSGLQHVEAGFEPGAPGDVDTVLRTAGREGCDLVITDSYLLHEGHLGAIRRAGHILVSLDDLCRHPFPSHVVVNGGAHARALDYVSAVGDTRFLLGPTYALLRPEFWKAPRTRTDRGVERILVTFGGGDPTGLTQRVIRGLDELDDHVSLTVLVGPMFRDRAEIDRAARGASCAVELAEPSFEVRRLMEEADLAISAAGQTLYELAAVGTPAVAVQVADNQRDTLAALVSHGAVVAAGASDDADIGDRVRQAVGELIRERSARDDLRQAGQRLVDGRGALRVARAIRAVVEDSI